MVTSSLVLLFGKFTPAYSALCKTKLPKADEGFLLKNLFMPDLSKRCTTNSDCSSSDTCDDLDSREVQMVLCYCFRQFSSVLCTLQSNYAGYVRHHEALGIQDFYALDGYLCDNSIHYIMLWCGRMSFPDFKLVGAILSVCNDVKYLHYVTGNLSVGSDIHRSKQTMSVRKFAMSSMPIKTA